MNILQVTPILDPNNLWTGPHRAVFDISKKLSEMGNNVTVCTSDMLDITTRIKRNPQSVYDGFEIVRVRNISCHLSNTSGLLITPDLCKFLSERIQDFDIIHIHEYTTYQNIVVHKFAKSQEVPYVLQAHGSLPRIGKRARKWIYNALFGYRLLNDASKVIALTRAEAQQYKNAGVPEERTTIIPNGIDLSEYADLPPRGSFKKKFSMDDNEKIVLYIGRIHRIKGVDFLLRAFSHIAEKLENVRLVVVGPDNGYLPTCRNLARQLKVEKKVLFTGALFGVEKLAAYVDADVVVLPSRYEIFGYVVLESYACSKPVVASRTGGLREIVFHGKTGLLVKPGNVMELCLAICALLNDDSTRISMGMQARKVVEEEFSIEKVKDKLEATYREILGK